MIRVLRIMLGRPAGTRYSPHRAGQCAHAFCDPQPLLTLLRSAQRCDSLHGKPALTRRPPHNCTAYDTCRKWAVAGGEATCWSVRLATARRQAPPHRAAMAEEVQVSPAMETLAQDAIVWATQHGLVRVTRTPRPICCSYRHALRLASPIMPQSRPDKLCVTRNPIREASSACTKQQPLRTFANRA